MLDYIIRFYRSITFLMLGICTTSVLLFLFYIYYLQDYTDFSKGLKHGLSMATLLVIWETYVFLRRQSIFFQPIKIPLTIVGFEKEKGKSALKVLRTKILLTAVVLIIVAIVVLLNMYSQNLYLKGIKIAMLICAPLFLIVSSFLFIKYRTYLKRLL